MVMNIKIPSNEMPSICRSCGQTGQKYSLRGNGHGKWYYHLDCWNCRYRQQRDRQNQWRAEKKAKDPEGYKRIVREQQLKRYFKMTLEDYEQRIKDQNGCAICGEIRGLNKMPVDHCHKTGKIRGILCHYCNKGLGQFFDNPTNLRKAADYIDRWTESV